MFWKKSKSNRGRIFTEEERTKSHQSRLINNDIKNTEKQIELEEKKAHLLELKDILRERREQSMPIEYNSNSGEEVFLKALTPVLDKFLGGKAGNNIPDEPVEDIPSPDFSDEEINQIIKIIPKKYRLLAKFLTEENLKRILLSLDEHSILDDNNVQKIILRLKQ